MMKPWQPENNRKLSARLDPVGKNLAFMLQKVSAFNECIEVIDLTNKTNFIYFDSEKTPVLYGYSAALSFRKELKGFTDASKNQEIYYLEAHVYTLNDWKQTKLVVLDRTIRSGEREIIAEIRGDEVPCVKNEKGLETLIDLLATPMLKSYTSGVRDPNYG